MTEKETTPITWQPSEITVKNPAQSNEYFGNCVSWSKKSRINILGEVREGCKEHLQNVIDARDAWIDVIDAKQSKYNNLISYISLAIYGNGLDPDDDEYSPGLKKIITDIYGEPENVHGQFIINTSMLDSGILG